MLPPRNTWQHLEYIVERTLRRHQKLRAMARPSAVGRQLPCSIWATLLDLIVKTGRKSVADPSNAGIPRGSRTSRMTLMSGLGVLMLMIVASLACTKDSPAPAQGPGSQPPVTADFTSDVTTAEAETPIQFTDLSSGDISQRLWEFGDGSSSTERNPTHTYNDPGAYTVSLTVTGSKGTDTQTKEAYVRIGDAYRIPSSITGETYAIYDWARTPEGSALLEQVPCYCGCGSGGHEHARHCFWTDDGAFDAHGDGCGQCLDIAAETRQMHEQGKGICEIRAEIDRQYSLIAHFGTDTPMPEGCES